MPSPKLISVNYQDSGNGIHLTGYADTLIYEKTSDNSGKLIGIRFGGYPEQVRGMSDTIYGGGDISAERQGLPPLRLQSLPKQYTRQQSMDGVYAEAVVFAEDDSSTPVSIADPANEGQTKLETPPRACYIFTPPGDDIRLFEEIDKRVRVPLIPEFRDYMLRELSSSSALEQLSTVCLNEKFDAWRLTCTADDGNIIRIVEHGLKSGEIQIPSVSPDSAVVFDSINTVSQYLREFGVTIAERIKNQFVPLFDPSKEPISKEVLSVNDNIAAHTGYHLYDAQLAAAEGLKRKLDHHDPALLIAECGSGKTKIGMTATLINGYASGIFHLLYRLFPRSMLLDNKHYASPESFNQEYGVTESTYEVTAAEYNANRRASRRKVRERLLPGVSPLVYSRFLLENAVFLSLMDMGKDLPEYEEIPIPIKLPEEIRNEYDRIAKNLRELMREDRKAAKKILSAYMGLLTVYPDQPYAHEPIVHPITGEEVVQPKDLATIEDLHPKDEKALSIVREKVALGGRVLIYTSWIRIDSQQKLLTALTHEGIRATILSASVKAEVREAWVDAEVANGLQVLIVNPACVETGLDLNAFTTLIYYNVGYNLFTLRQASRRSWRINQTAPRIDVYFLFYEGVMQARAIELMASKLAVAGLVEGNFSDEGLAALSDCRDLTSQLAMELTSGIKESVEDIGAVFKRMAILHPDRPIAPVVQPQQTQPTLFSPNWTLPEPVAVTRDVDPFEVFVFASTVKRRKKQPEPEPDNDQLTLFDLPKTA